MEAALPALNCEIRYQYHLLAQGRCQKDHRKKRCAAYNAYLTAPSYARFIACLSLLLVRIGEKGSFREWEICASFRLLSYAGAKPPRYFSEKGTIAAVKRGRCAAAVWHAGSTFWP